MHNGVIGQNLMALCQAECIDSLYRGDSEEFGERYRKATVMSASLRQYAMLLPRGVEIYSKVLILLLFLIGAIVST